MENRKLQKLVADSVKKNRLGMLPEHACMDLMSELGELSKEIAESSNYGRGMPKPRSEIREEMGDVFWSLINLANVYKIDLETELRNSIRKMEQRMKKTGRPGSR